MLPSFSSPNSHAHHEQAHPEVPAQISASPRAVEPGHPPRSPPSPGRQEAASWEPALGKVKLLTLQRGDGKQRETDKEEVVPTRRGELMPKPRHP